MQDTNRASSRADVRRSGPAHAFLVPAGLLLVLTAARLAAAAPLSASEFMDEVRTVLQYPAWGSASGTVRHRGKAGRAKVSVVGRWLFRAGDVDVRFVLGEADRYRVSIQSSDDGGPQVEVQRPEKASVVTPENLGVLPEDFAVSFLFWDVVGERGRDAVRGMSCRVLRLRDPGSGRQVAAWISVEHRFPIRVEWYAPEEDEPWRVCEFTSFKKTAEGTVFLTAMRVEGRDWSTRLKFDNIELHDARATPVPANFLQDNRVDLGG